jgi:chromosome partitioning protein
MQVVAVLSEKGGAGKSTFAIHLAVAGQLDGLDSVIIDLDPQASALGWADRRGDKPEAASVPLPRLPKLIDDLRANGVQLVIIDTGRDSNDTAYAAARAADLIVVPCQPGGFDVTALERTVRLIQLSGKQGAAHIVPNKVHVAATKGDAEVREAVAAYGLPVAPITIRDRSCYRKASVTGRTAQETGEDQRAADEIRQLYMWIRSHGGLSSTHKVDTKTRR